jgi:hypothetical protein
LGARLLYRHRHHFVEYPNTNFSILLLCTFGLLVRQPFGEVEKRNKRYSMLLTLSLSLSMITTSVQAACITSACHPGDRIDLVREPKKMLQIIWSNSCYNGIRFGFCKVSAFPLYFCDWG